MASFFGLLCFPQAVFPTNTPGLSTALSTAATLLWNMALLGLDISPTLDKSPPTSPLQSVSVRSWPSPLEKPAEFLQHLEENQCLHDCLLALASPPLDLISKYHCFHSLKPLIHKNVMLAPTWGLCLLSLSLIFHVIGQITFSHETFFLDSQPLIPHKAHHHHHQLLYYNLLRYS